MESFGDNTRTAGSLDSASYHMLGWLSVGGRDLVIFRSTLIGDISW